MYAQLEEHFFSNPKVLAVSLAARGLYCQALSYAVHHLTDGELRPGVAAFLGGPDWGPLAAELTWTHLWEPTTEGGYRIHDFLNHNRSSNDVKTERKAARERMRMFRRTNAEQTLNERRSASSRRNKLRRSRAPRQNLQEARVKQEKEREIASLTTIQQSATATSNLRAENVASELLDFVNETAGTHFRPVVANLRMIRARLQEYDHWTLAAVVRRQWAHWHADEKMRPYFRPATLFNREKCAQYVGQLTTEDDRWIAAHAEGSHVPVS